MNMRICKKCGKEFIPTNNNQRFCTKECRQEIRICDVCGKEYSIYYKRKDHLCSRECLYESLKRKKFYEKICPVCNNIFSTAKTYQIYCSVKCKCDNIKINSHESRTCPQCGINFESRKSSMQICCSHKCSMKYTPHMIKRVAGFNLMDKYGVKNAMELPSAVAKIKSTKLARYGNDTWNNPEKNKQTCLTRYGVSCAYLMIRKSNGIGISKGQKKLYDLIKAKYEDAISEYNIEDLNISVDIYIPSKNLIIEFFGDYWHCNPNKYDSTYYHSQIHKHAYEVWNHDKARMENIEHLGFKTMIIWECDFRTGNYCIE